MAYDFGVTGGCEKSRKVIIKAWRRNHHEDYITESQVYDILSASPMKGFPILIEENKELSRQIYAVVLEILGPSLDNLSRLLPDNRFDEQMTVSLAIQMVRDIRSILDTNSNASSHFFYKIDRYAALHARNIIHNGAKPGNVCLAPLSSNAIDASTLNLIDFGYSFIRDGSPIDCGDEFSGNKRFWSALSYHRFSASS